jgi:hypothetical protein
MHVPNAFRRGSAGQSGHRVRGLLIGALIALSTPAYGATVAQVDKLLPPDGQGDPGDFFGVRVAISGDFAVVGAELDDNHGEDSGSAFVFERSGDIWVFRQKLTSPSAAAGDRFGEWVDIDGDTIAVGALDDADSGVMSGSVSVFRYSGTSWYFEDKLLASDGELGDRFGETVYVDGDRIGAGARFADHGMGAAYIFTRSGSSWTQQQKLTAPEREFNDWFGTQIAINGNTAIVGARTDDIEGTEDAGAAYIFSLNTGVWTLEDTLTAGDPHTSDEFGMAVDIDGDTAVVSAFKDDENGTDAGAVYVFMRTADGWVEQQKLLATDDFPDFDEVGTQLSLQGNSLVAGGSLTRAVFLFKRADGHWTQHAKIVPNDPNDARFGTSTDLDGRSIVGGARLSKDNGLESGSAFVFDIIHADGSACLADLTAIVMNMNLQQGIDKSIDAKLQAISHAVEDIDSGNTTGAVNMLKAFKQTVETQLGINLTAGQAATLFSLADGCINLLE